MTRLPPRCGTPSGYNRHQTQGQTACRPCKDAIAAYRREQVRAAMPPRRRYTRGPVPQTLPHQRDAVRALCSTQPDAVLLIEVLGLDKEET